MSFFSFFLYTGITFADLKESRNLPLAIERLKIWDRQMMSWGGKTFKTLGEIPSRPVLFLFWNFAMILDTSSGEVGLKNIELMCLFSAELGFPLVFKKLVLFAILLVWSISGNLSWKALGILEKKLLNPSAIFCLSETKMPST